MKLPRAPHRWNVSPRRAVELQRQLASQVREMPLRRAPRLIAGGDCAFGAAGAEIIAGWVVWDAVDQLVIEQHVVRRPVRFPYVPGLLSFREAPALLAAARRIRCEPDLFMIDGQGRAHPRRLGLACHLGLFLGRPTVGCAKSRLCGTHEPPGPKRGEWKALMAGAETIGRIVRTQSGRNPLYVIVGHKITISDAAETVLDSCLRFRIPEPTRLADRLVGSAKLSA